MVWETEEFIHWQARETEGKYKLSQGGRNPQCMFLRNRKCPFINSWGKKKKKILTVSLTHCFYLRLRFHLLGLPFFRPCLSAYSHGSAPFTLVPKWFSDEIRSGFPPPAHNLVQPLTQLCFMLGFQIIKFYKVIFLSLHQFPNHNSSEMFLDLQSEQSWGNYVRSSRGAGLPLSWENLQILFINLFWVFLWSLEIVFNFHRTFTLLSLKQLLSSLLINNKLSRF